MAQDRTLWRILLLAINLFKLRVYYQTAGLSKLDTGYFTFETFSMGMPISASTLKCCSL